MQLRENGVDITRLSTRRIQDLTDYCISETKRLWQPSETLWKSRIPAAIDGQAVMIVDAIAEGTAPADVVGPKLRALEAERLSLEEQLAAAEDKAKTVALHPAAIRNYLADVEALRSVLDDEEATERPELIAPLRRLLHGVVVHAEPGMKGPFDVEIKGRLQQLLGAPFLRRSLGGGPLVAGDRYIAKPTISEPVFSYRRAVELA
ncbi:hypothetical protein H8B02_28570 [Bradyrhizobium sp. Pear77]|uniref:hypothetical protein n=1 Tax=Bradyrhizobium altum TaxID=1571202 RepID=UPI001E4000BB|nr:hypothetical protein [Bradyrhizobium altum]MCC8957246.1 hypothetical protein [Bradyrhizobium altum]